MNWLLRLFAVPSLPSNLHATCEKCPCWRPEGPVHVGTSAQSILNKNRLKSPTLWDPDTQYASVLNMPQRLLTPDNHYPAAE